MTLCDEALVFLTLRGGLLAHPPALLGQEDGLYVGEDASLSDGHSLEQLVQLLVVADGELEVAGVDPLFLVVAGSVAGQLQDLGREVLHDGGEIDWCPRSHSLGVVSLAEEAMYATDGELETGSGRAALGLGSGLASFSSSRHGAS